MSSENSNLAPLSYRVFVYGTLKKGEPNHYLMTDAKRGCARLIGTGKTVKKYPLVIASKYNIPFLISEEGVGKNIIGEIYEIDENMLKALDELENHPSYYTRRQEPIDILQWFINGNGATVEHCWTYFLCNYRPELLKLPYLDNYSTSGDHNTPYIESDDTTTVDEIYQQ